MEYAASSRSMVSQKFKRRKRGLSDGGMWSVEQGDQLIN
jgi:hypothetical protein